MIDNPKRRYLILEDNYMQNSRVSSIEIVTLNMSNYNEVDPFYKRIRKEIETYLDLEGDGRQYNQDSKDRYFSEFNTFSQMRGKIDYTVWNLHNQYFNDTQLEKFLLGKTDNYRTYSHVDITDGIINFGMGCWPSKAQIKKIKAFTEKNDENTFQYVYLVGNKKVVYATLKAKRLPHNQPDYNYFKIDKNGDLKEITYAEAFDCKSCSKILDLHRLRRNILFIESNPRYVISNAKYQLSYDVGFSDDCRVPFSLEPKLKLRDTNGDSFHVMKSTKNSFNLLICPVDDFHEEWQLL